MPNIVQRVPAKDRRTRVAGSAWRAPHGGEAAPVAAEWGEDIALSRQPLEQMFATAQAAADAFNEINSPNENSSKEVY